MSVGVGATASNVVSSCAADMLCFLRAGHLHDFRAVLNAPVIVRSFECVTHELQPQTHATPCHVIDRNRTLCMLYVRTFACAFGSSATNDTMLMMMFRRVSGDEHNPARIHYNVCTLYRNVASASPVCVMRPIRTATTAAVLHVVPPGISHYPANTHTIVHGSGRRRFVYPL